MLSLVFFILFMTIMSFKFNLFILIYSLFFCYLYFIFMSNSIDYFYMISFNMGMDFYSFSLVLLSFWLFIFVLYSILNLKNVYLNYLSVLILLTIFFLYLCFSSLSYFNFYFYFECSVLPVFLVIYGWGYQPERVFSSLYFFFYTLFSSLPLLLYIMSLNNFLGYFYLKMIFFSENFYMFFFFIFSFLVKLPMFFFHLWLPSAHVEAPTGGSMILAGIMLKLGGYGLIRVMYMFTSLINLYSFIFISISLVGSLYVSMFCLLQSDLKVLVAYSSVSHMNLIICSLMSLSYFGHLGSLYLMLSHGLVSSGLFYLVGCLFDRVSSRSMFLMSGLINLMPSFSMYFFFFVISNMSFPPSLNLISEFFICFSLLNWDFLALFFMIFIFFFSSCAMISLFSFVCHGQFTFLSQSLDPGLIREFYLFFMHLIPLYLFFLNLDFFWG